MDMDAVASFLAVAEHGGYASAGRVLDLPKSSLSRKVATLERDLGVRLFERTSRQFRLTLEGVELQRRARGLLAEWTDMEEQLKSTAGPLTGRLRISVPVLFGHTYLGRVAADFVARHPGVQLEAVVDDRQVDILKEGFDACLRANPQPDSNLTGRVLVRTSPVLVATPELAASIGYPKAAVEQLIWPAIVRPGWGDRGSWAIKSAGQPINVRGNVIMNLSSPLAMRDAVLAGAGAAILPENLAKSDLRTGALLQLGVFSGPPSEFWILHASGRLPSRRLLAFMDVLSGWLSSN